MKRLVILLLIVLLIPVAGISQFHSMEDVVDVPKKEMKILSGNPKYFKKTFNYFIQFDYSDLKIGGYENEIAYIEYMREDAELRRKSADDWENKWFSDRKSIFEPKFLEMFHKYATYNTILDTTDKNQDFVLKLHTQFIEIGYNQNFKKSPTYINVLVTISDKNSIEEPLVISMKYLIGNEVMNSYSDGFRRIEEAYAKCGKELAKYMRKVIY